jgi:signal peptidase
MEPDAVGLSLGSRELQTLAGQRARQGIPALRFDGSVWGSPRGRDVIPVLALDGTKVRALPRLVYALGYAILILTTVVVVALATVPKLTPLRFYAVTSGSMVPALPVGTVTIVNTANRTPRVGEIVAFQPPSDPGEIFTHRVIAVLPGGSFKTEGDALRTPDPWTVPRSDLVGTVTATIPYAAWGLSVLKIGVLLSLAMYLLRFVVRRGFSRRLAPELLVGGVLTGSLLYLFDVLRPVFGAGVAFISMSHRAVRINVINNGWVPIRAFSLANPTDRTGLVRPDSTLLSTLHFAGHSQVTTITTIKVVPEPSLVDFIVMGLLVFSPFLLSLLAAWRVSRRGERIEVSSARPRWAGRRRGGGRRGGGRRLGGCRLGGRAGGMA